MIDLMQYGYCFDFILDTAVGKVPVTLIRKQSYDCIIISFVIRLRMLIMLNVIQLVFAFLYAYRDKRNDPQINI